MQMHPQESAAGVCREPEMEGVTHWAGDPSKPLCSPRNVTSFDGREPESGTVVVVVVDLGSGIEC